MTPTTGIVTPEAVVLEFRSAGLATRSLAKLFDVLIMGVVMLLVGGLALFIVGSGSETGAIIVVSLGIFITVVLAPALCETFWNGVTPGKFLMGLRVLTTEGGPIAFRHALLRGLLQLIELPTGAAVFVALSNPRSQRLGDLAAGTFVVSERAAITNPVPIAFFPPRGLEHYCHTLDTAAVSSEQFLLVRNFLLRVAEIDAGARYALSVRLADPLRRMCATVVPQGMSAETFLICVASSYQIHHGGLPAPDQVHFPGVPIPGTPSGRHG